MEKYNLVPIYDQFAVYLEAEDRASAVAYALQLFQTDQISIPLLYEMILAPLLNRYEFPNDNTRIVREHIRTAIVRSIVEACYPQVVAFKQSVDYVDVNKKVLITCPTEEYHEMGARMAMDFFELNGFHATYTGANTPGPDILAAIEYQRPDFVAVSVSNFYNLIKAKVVIDDIQRLYPHVQILLGGAVFADPNHRQVVVGARYINSYESVQQLAQEVRHASA